MKVTINIMAGNFPQREPKKKDIRRMLFVVEKAIVREPLTGSDQIDLIDVKGILQGIKEEIPE